MRDKITVLQPLAELRDPHVLDDNKSRRSIISAMYETLVERDQGGRFAPVLAESWETSDDAKSWTFRLREHVSVHDGRFLKSGDVIGSLHRSMDPSLGGVLGTQGVYQSYLGDAKFLELNNHTIRMITKQSFADLLDLLVDIPIVSMDALDSKGADTAGSGPYKLLSRKEGEVIMESFPNYWKDEPAVKQVEWIAEPDENRRVEALLDRRADIASEISVEGKRAIDASEGSVVTSRSSLCVIFMFNLQSESPCKDRRIRQALNYALNKQALIASIKNSDADPLNGPLTPLHLGYDPSTATYTFDPHNARSLMAEAGFRDGFKVVLDIPTRLPDEAPHLARLIASQYQEIGIQTEVREFSDREAYSQMVRNKLIDDLCCFDSSPLSTYRVLREKFHSGFRGPWWQGYSNPVVDTLIDQAQNTIDISHRQTIYRQAFRMLRDDAPWLFLYSPLLHWGRSDAAKDWRPGVDGLIKLGLANFQ